ncbi:hypothetical protein DL771_007471 [Monosporascus sp. 5C6A]|nr:hypothetical protein DL771_007471 [Monosporascus sp. 5C6A]
MIWSARALWGLGNVQPAVASTLMAESLIARKALWAGLQGSLPDSRRQLDMKHTFEVDLAAAQQAMVDTALGEPNATAGFLVRLSNSRGGEAWFKSARFLRRRFKPDPYPFLEWSTDETLQLQQRANERLGLGRLVSSRRSSTVYKGLDAFGSARRLGRGVSASRGGVEEDHHFKEDISMDDGSEKVSDVASNGVPAEKREGKSTGGKLNRLPDRGGKKIKRDDGHYGDSPLPLSLVVEQDGKRFQAACLHNGRQRTGGCPTSPFDD